MRAWVIWCATTSFVSNNFVLTKWVMVLEEENRCRQYNIFVVKWIVRNNSFSFLIFWGNSWAILFPIILYPPCTICNTRGLPHHIRIWRYTLVLPSLVFSFLLNEYKLHCFKKNNFHKTPDSLKNKWELSRKFLIWQVSLCLCEP